MIPAHLKRRQAERIREARATPSRRSMDVLNQFAAGGSSLMSLVKQSTQSIGESYATKSAPELRQAARVSRRANPFMKRIADVWIQNVLGPHDLTLQSTPGNTRGGVNAALAARIESIWYDMFCPTANVRGGSFSSVLRQIVPRKPIDGEGVLEIVPNAASPLGFGVRAVDCDLIDWSYSDILRDGTRIVHGVEITALGKPIAYHVLSHHYRDTNALGPVTRRRVLARDFLLYAHRDAPESVRGVPMVVPALIRLDMMNGTQEALVMLHRIAASKGGFFVADKDAEDAIQADPGKTFATMEATPGFAEQLNPGWRWESWDPGQPSEQYAPLQKSLREEAAISGNVTYHAMTGDLSEANYGSLRHGEINAREAWRMEHVELAETIVDPVFQRAISQAVSFGLLQVPNGMSFDALVSCTWHGRVWEWLDPQKDAMGIGTLMANRLTSPQRELNKRGEDWRKVFDELKEAQDYADSLGLREATAPDPATAADPAKPARVLPLRGLNAG